MTDLCYSYVTMDKRHFMRKKSFDYGVGVFHVTICTKDRTHLFGAIEMMQ